MIEVFFIPAIIAAAVWYGVYRMHMRRWENGKGDLPDKMKFIISYLIVQVLYALFLSGLSRFPAQR